MAIELLSEIKKQAAMLSAEEMRSLASFLNEEAEKKSVADSKNGEHRRKAVDKETSQKAVDWLKANKDKYGRQYVALYDGVLVGHGKTIREAKAEAKKNGYDDPFIVYVFGENEEIHGGW